MIGPLARRAGSFARRHRTKAIDYAAAFVSSTSYAVGVYAVTLVFAFLFDAATVGRFRYVLSVLMILSAFTLVEANKLFLKTFYEHGRNLLLLAATVRLAVSLLVANLAIGAVLLGLSGSVVDRTTLILCIAALPLFATFDLHNFINFAQRRYLLNALTNLAKYTFLVLAMGLACLFVLRSGSAPDGAVVAYFWLLGGLNLALFVAFAATFGLRWSWSRPFIADSAKLSAGGIPQTIVENLDKIVVGTAFGPAMLGIYALNVTTGRLLNTAVKPGLVVLYPYLTRNSVGGRTYLVIFLVAAALIGAAAPIVYALYGRAMDAIYLDYFGLVLVSMAAFPFSAVYQIKLNEVIFNTGQVGFAAQASSLVGVAALVVLAIGLMLGERWGVHVCAAALPLRYLAGLAFLFVRSGRRNAAPSPAPAAPLPDSPAGPMP